MIETSINSLEELEQFTAELTNEIKPGSVVFLNGEMGSGKTTFVQAFAKELGLLSTVKSPTFVIHNEYDELVHHIDLYRLENKSEVKELKLKDIKDDSYTFIEWANKFDSEMAEMFKEKNKYEINFEVTGENSRLIRFEKLA
jgi:tRNA threonylcarbamoyladenosine biosynthesis protein TsaE